MIVVIGTITLVTENQEENDTKKNNTSSSSSINRNHILLICRSGGGSGSIISGRKVGVDTKVLLLFCSHVLEFASGGVDLRTSENDDSSVVAGIDGNNDLRSVKTSEGDDLALEGSFSGARSGIGGERNLGDVL